MTSPFPETFQTFAASIIRVGLISATIFLVLAGIFASMVSLPRPVVASGTLMPRGETRTIQHETGGRIDTIHVTEGSEVSAGDALVSFDTTVLRAEYNALITSLIVLQAEKEGLLMDPAGTAPPAFSNRLMDQARAARLEDILDRRAAQIGRRSERRTAILDQIDRSHRTLSAQHKAYTKARDAKGEQLRILRTVINRRRSLADRGIAASGEIDELAMQEAAILGELEEFAADIHRTANEIEQLERQTVEIDIEDDIDRLERIAALSRQIADTSRQLARVDRDLAAAIVRAPVAGQVIDLAVNTVGGVAAPGQILLQVVPHQEELVIEARVRPKDIDAVTAGMTSKIVLSALPQRNLPELSALLESIATDLSVDPVSGEPYYRARLTLSDVAIDIVRTRLDHPIRLVAGMPVEVFINDERMSPLQYLMSPLSNSMRRAFQAD